MVFKGFKKGVLSAFFMVMILIIGYSVVSAIPIDPFNDRPVSIGSPPPGEKSLQWTLDYMFGTGAVSATADQQSAGMWTVSANPASIMPVLVVEYAALANQNIFGIWSDPDMDTNTPPNRVDIFWGAATPGFFAGWAALYWDTAGLWIGGWNLTYVNIGGPYTGINPYSFGFYLRRENGPIFYTVDQLNNGGAAQVLAFNKPGTDTWAIAFEDLPLAGSGRDYNDMVVKIESIQPVPEPGTLMLLGSGLLGAGLYGWRRRKNNN